MTDEYYNRFLNKGFTPAFDCRPVDESTLLRFSGKLPDRLLRYWKEFGFCGYGNGIFWTVNPADYEDVLEMWLGDSPLWGRENYYVIARTAFGELYVIGEDSVDSTIVNPHFCNILPGETAEKELTTEDKDRYIGIFFGTQTIESLDVRDKNDKPLFKKALKKHGPLKHDEMYTFVPALSLGGAADIDHLQIVKLHDQLALLAELDRPVILKSVSELFDN